MAAQRIEQAIRDAGAACNEVDENLNYGGCGVYAFYLAKTLRKAGVRPRIRVYGDEPVRVSLYRIARELRADGKLTNMKAIRKAVGLDPRAHIVVEALGNCWDSDGTVGMTYRYWQRLPSPLPLYALEAWIGERYLWNPWFNRRKIPAIQSAIHSAFVKHGLV